MTSARTTQLVDGRQGHRRLRTAVVAGLVLAAVGPLVGASAGASPPGGRTSAACPTSAGVTVVVDFGPYGGVAVECAPDAGTGLDTLEAAGFSWSGTAQFWDFVCRINGLPTAEDDPCVRTPPASAYWTYWHAERGGSWVYSTRSASAYDPPAGRVEGWAFGAGDAPGSPPPPPVPPPPPPPPPPTTTTAPADPEPTEPGPGDDDEATVPTTSTASTAPPTTTTTGSPTTPESIESESSVPDRSASASASPAATATGGSPTGTVIGLVAAAVVAGIGGVIALRRRPGATTL